MMVLLAGGHHRGGWFLSTLMHGFAWRLGSEAAHAIFHAAPALLVIGLLAVAVHRVHKRWRGRRD